MGKNALITKPEHSEGNCLIEKADDGFKVKGEFKDLKIIYRKKWGWEEKRPVTVHICICMFIYYMFILHM